jgi:integrase
LLTYCLLSAYFFQGGNPVPTLTKRFVDSLKPPESGYKLEWDDKLKGFGVKVTARGVITFFIFYRNERMQQRRITIGRYGVLSADDARDEAKGKLYEATHGKDPAEDRKHKRSEATFSSLADEYTKRHASQKRSGHEDIRIINRDLLKPWGNLPAKEIRRRDVIRLVDEIKDRGAPIMANRTLAVIRRVYNFGISRDLVDVNPTVLVRRPGKEQRRERALKADEVKRLWERLDSMLGVGAHVKAGLQLILITGQRSGEILNMEWSELDFESATWEIPSTKTKNAQPHRVPLSPMALKILDNLPKHGNHVFPSRIGSGFDESRPMKTNALALAIRRNRKLLGLEEFTPHDLRRTCASFLGSLGVEQSLIGRILNHTERGVTSIYNRYAYEKEKRRALMMWAGKLEEIVTGKKTKVVSIAR